MSLIQEALRRQQEEQSGEGEAPAGAPKPPGAPPPAPAAGPTPGAPGAPPAPPTGGASAPSLPRPPGAPLPPPPAPPAGAGQSPAAAAASPTISSDADGKTSSRPWGSMAGIIVIVLVVVGALVGLMMFANKKIKESRESRALAVNAPAQQAGGASSTGQGAPSLPSTSPTPANDGNAATQKVPNGDPQQSSTASTDPASPNAGTSSAATTSDPGTGAATTEPVPVVAAEWPELTLTGVIGKGIRGAATLNGQIVAVGETIEGAEVVYIGDEGVKLEYEAESRYIRVGQRID